MAVLSGSFLWELLGTPSTRGSSYLLGAPPQIGPKALDQKAHRFLAFKLLMGRPNKYFKGHPRVPLGLVYSQHLGHLSVEMSQTVEVRIARTQLFIYLFDYECIYFCCFHHTAGSGCSWAARDLSSGRAYVLVQS